MSWTERNGFGVPYYGPAALAPVVLQNAVNGDGVWPYDQWLDVTVPGIPDDVFAVHLCGIEIITMGYASETADLHIRVRRWLAPINGQPNPYSPDYVGQALAAPGVGGIRSPFACWCAVDGRRFQLRWSRSTPPPYPEHASYGLKVFCDAYQR